MKHFFAFNSLAILVALAPQTCTGGGPGGSGGTGGAPGACTTDADCRTFSDYCTGCDCRALSKSEKDPVCPHPGVQCLRDPCLDEHAVCSAGRCELASGASPLKYYATCGEPVCRGYTEKPGVPLCTPEQVAGAPCTKENEVCDPKSECNALLRCTDTDPAVMCPISSRRFKDDIEYVNHEELEKLADEVGKVRLARYHYKSDPKRKEHLGFIIEDRPDSPAVEKDRERVDLYSYTSMAVAALQVQKRQLEQQKSELEATRRDVLELKKQLTQTRAACAPAVKR